MPEVRRFGLTGPTVWSDPALNAYRPDVADVALAGQVITSHYAEAVLRTCTRDVSLMSEPFGRGEVLAVLIKGDRFALLDCDRGQAWGYSAGDHRVGYVNENALS